MSDDEDEGEDDGGRGGKLLALPAALVQVL